MPNLRIRFDVWIALAVIGLLIAGMLVVYSSSYDIAFRSPLSNNDPTFYFRRQFLFMVVGLIAMGGALIFDYHHFRYLSLLVMGSTILLLLIVLFFGSSNFGAQRGLFNNSIQPSELAKLAMIMYVSHWLSTKGDRVRSIAHGLMPFGIMVGFVAALIMLQPDLSTAILVALISFTLFFLAGADWRHFGLALVLIPIVFAIAYYAFGHVSQRIDAWQVAWQDPLLSEQLQIKLISIGLGSGGLLGRGPGHGQIKYFVPAAHTDGPFAVWGEEFGFIGSLFVILSFAFLAYRGILAARRARDAYGYLLAMGVTVWISYQALLNIAVVTSTIPFTGVPLPFMSYGGTSLVVTLAGVGILLNVSRDPAIGPTLKQKEFARRQQPPPPRRRQQTRGVVRPQRGLQPQRRQGVAAQLMERFNRGADEGDDLRRWNGGPRVPRSGGRGTFEQTWRDRE